MTAAGERYNLPVIPVTVAKMMPLDLNMGGGSLSGSAGTEGSLALAAARSWPRACASPGRTLLMRPGGRRRRHPSPVPGGGRSAARAAPGRWRRQRRLAGQ